MPRGSSDPNSRSSATSIDGDASAVPRFRLAELIAALSLASDLGTGQPWEHALRTCLLALGVAEELGATEAELAEVYNVALLRFVGCSADSHETRAFVGGDDIAFRAGIAPLFVADLPDLLSYVVSRRAQGAGRPSRGVV